MCILCSALKDLNFLNSFVVVENLKGTQSVCWQKVWLHFLFHLWCLNSHHLSCSWLSFYVTVCLAGQKLTASHFLKTITAVGVCIVSIPVNDIIFVTIVCNVCCWFIAFHIEIWIVVAAVSSAKVEDKTPENKASTEKKPEVKTNASVDLKAADKNIKTAESDKTKISDRGKRRAPGAIFYLSRPSKPQYMQMSWRGVCMCA
jgi:hypothetical protein